MKKKIINTVKAPKPVGPYNQAVIAGNLVFVSGQIPINPETNSLVLGTTKDQAEQVLKNLSAILTEAGTTLEKALKVTIYLRDMNDFSEMNSVYEKFFEKDSAPARTTVEVSRLPKDVSIEIDVIAVK